MTLDKKAILFAPVILVSALTLSCGFPDSSKIFINGAGSTFPAKIYTRWLSNLSRLGGPKVNYQAIGSGAGRKEFLAGRVDFLASEDPMKEKDIQKVNKYH